MGEVKQKFEPSFSSLFSLRIFTTQDLILKEYLSKKARKDEIGICMQIIDAKYHHSSTTIRLLAIKRICLLVEVETTV